MSDEYLWIKDRLEALDDRIALLEAIAHQPDNLCGPTPAPAQVGEARECPKSMSGKHCHEECECIYCGAWIPEHALPSPQPAAPTVQPDAREAAIALAKLPIGCLPCEREEIVQHAIDAALSAANARAEEAERTNAEVAAALNSELPFHRKTTSLADSAKCRVEQMESWYQALQTERAAHAETKEALEEVSAAFLSAMGTVNAYTAGRNAHPDSNLAKWRKLAAALSANLEK